MECEPDPKKSEGNREKLRIDFYDEVQAVRGDSDLIEIPVKTADEPRLPVVGRIPRI